jgi:BlaI family penicillinase repressor
MSSPPIPGPKDWCVDAIGPLQLRVMQYIWRTGPATVHAVHDALNREPGLPPLAYTTILTVMRNLSRRHILSQTRGGRSHVFSALVDEASYKLEVVRQMSRTLFGDDIEVLVRFLLAQDVELPLESRERLAAAIS